MVSVIIPVYNGAEFIKDAVESVIFQDYKDIELIVVNDGSTDNTLEILQTIWKKYKPNGRIITIPNGGLANARNVGIQNATGEYMCNLDADDYLEKDIFLSIFEKCEVGFDVCYYGYRDVEEGGECRSDYLSSGMKYINNLSGTEAVKNKLKRQMWICQGSAIYKRTLIAEYNNYNIKGINQGEDLYFITSMLAVSKRVVCIEQIGVNIRYRKNSMMHDKYNESFLQGIKAVENLNIKLKSVCSEKDYAELEGYLIREKMEQICAVSKKIINSKNIKYDKKIYMMRELRAKNFKGMNNLSDMIPKKKYVEYSIFSKNLALYYVFVKTVCFFRSREA